MTDGSFWIEKTGTLFPGFPEETSGTMAVRFPRIKDIVSGVIVLAARGKETIRLEKVYSTLHAMKPHEPVLSGIHFSLTGAICYSHDVDLAIHFLVDGGFLEIVDGSAKWETHSPEFVNYLSGFLTNSQIQTLHSASLRFHERVRRDVEDSRHLHDPPS